MAAAVLAAPIPAFAAPSENTPLDLGDEKPATEAAASGGGGGSFFRTIVGLIVVLGIIFALHWVLKQVKASKEGKASGLGLATVATLPVGGGRTLQLVRAGRDIVLLGIGEHGVTPIRTYTEDEARERGLLADDEPAAEPAKPARSVLELLRQKTVIR